MTRLNKSIKPSRPIKLLILLLVGAAALAGFGPAADRGRATAANNLGVAYMNQQRPGEALTKFREAIAADPSLTEARLNTAIALYNQQKLEESEAILRQIVEENGDDLRAWFNLGLIYKSTGANDKALEAFEKVAALDASENEDADTQYYIGLMLFQSGRHEEAVKAYERAIEINPFHVSAEFGLARALQRLRRVDEARAHLVKFQDLQRKKLGAPISLVYGEQGHYSLAVETRPRPKSAPPAIAVKFTDVTKDAGLRFQDTGGPATLSPGGNSAGAGACFFDYNNDALPDLLLLNSNGPGVLYKNDGKGKFEDVTKAIKLEVQGRGLACTAADFDNDGWIDVSISYTDAVMMYHNNDGLGFSDATAKTIGDTGRSIVGSPSGLTWLDYDHDGDVDLYASSTGLEEHDSGGNRLWRNNGDGTFIDGTDAAGLQGTGTHSAAVAADLNMDRAIDLLLTAQTGLGQILLNPRQGEFKKVMVRPDLNLSATIGVVTWDHDKDGVPDAAFTHADAPGISVWRNRAGTFDRHGVATPAWSSGWGLSTLDYDNDGWVDVTAVGEAEKKGEIRLLRNLGAKGFEDVTEALGLSAIELNNPRSVITADYDRDGDVDILVTQNGGPPMLLRNDGGNKNHSVRINLTGLADNTSAIGAKVEVFAGEMWQKFEIQAGSGYLGQSSLEIVAGIGKETEADIVRILWPTGVLQDEIGLAAGEVHKITEIDRRGSSCPVLFAWNGTRYEMISDALGPAVIGHWVGPGLTNTTDPDEYVKVPGDRIKLRDGKLSFRLGEPMEEAVYLDQVRLLAVDHPKGVDVYPKEYFAFLPPTPAPEILASRGARPLVSARDHKGHDALPTLLERDGKFVDGFKSAGFTGFATLHELELDLGQWNTTGDATSPLRLLMHGFIDYFTATSMYAADQAGLHPISPYVEALNEQGVWVRVVDDMGFPAGLLRTMVADLTGKLPPKTRRIRLVTNLKVYWDQILIDTTPDGEPVNVNEVPLDHAGLSFYGYPRFTDAGPRGNVTYLHDEVSPTGPYAIFAGGYTRYGDVRPLLTDIDDELAIFGPGEEIALEFDPSSLPPLPEGWVRDYVFFGHGFVKDMDFYSSYATTVGPLPFNDMGGYPYDTKKPYPLDAKQLEYLLKYNSRAASGKLTGSYRYDYTPRD